VANWIVKQAATQRDHTGWFVDWAQGGSKTSSGVIVNNDKAFQLSTVYDCIRGISEDVGKLPFKVYKSLEPKGKEPRPKHRVYRILHDQPNREMSALTFRQTLTAHALGWGNGYAEIERDIERRPINLWPLRPDRIRIYRLEDGWIWYEYRTDEDNMYWIRADNVLHIKGLGFDGLAGYNVIQYARECLGAALATQKMAASFFGRGAKHSGVLTHPTVLSDVAKANLRKSIESQQEIDSAQRLLIFEEGLKFEPNSIPPNEAQFLESRQFSVPEVARWFRMPPNKIGDMTRAQGWSTLEQTNIGYVTDTLLAWFVRWEQEVWQKLFSKREQEKGYFAKHVAAGLLRGDIKTRYESYSIGRDRGWLNADDIRELEDMNPLPEKKGQAYLIPLNMQEAKAPGEMDDIVKKQTAPEPQPRDNAEAFIEDAAGRIAAAEIRTIEKRIDKAAEDKDKFHRWMQSFLWGKHREYVSKTIEPLGLVSHWEAVNWIVTGPGELTNDDPPAAFPDFKAGRKAEIIDILKKEISCQKIKPPK
jgi:HK97 family phage portal protein